MLLEIARGLHRKLILSVAVFLVNLALRGVERCLFEELVFGSERSDADGLGLYAVVFYNAEIVFEECVGLQLPLQLLVKPVSLFHHRHVGHAVEGERAHSSVLGSLPYDVPTLAEQPQEHWDETVVNSRPKGVA